MGERNVGRHTTARLDSFVDAIKGEADNLQGVDCMSRQGHLRGRTGGSRTQWRGPLRKIVEVLQYGGSSMFERTRVRLECGHETLSNAQYKARCTECAQPVSMHLLCPRCGAIHLDEGEWATRPHKTHQCQSCKHEWRPFEYPTVGVHTVECLRVYSKA